MDADRWSSWVPAIPPAWGFYALGVAGLAFAIGHLLTEGEGVGTVLESGILVSLVAVVFYTGKELPDRSLSKRGAAVAVVYTCLFVVAFVLLATAIVLIWYYEQGHVEDAQFVVGFAGVLGAAVGGQANVYAVEFREAYERNEALTKLLTVNQRVLRHNLRNEVTIVLGYLESGSEGAGASPEDVAIVREHLEHLLKTSAEARQISDVWREDTIEAFDLPRVLADRVEAFQDAFPDLSVAIECADPPPALAHLALPDAIDELLENAALHAGDDVEITVTCRETTDGVAIEIADDGEGIPSEEIDVLFRSAETELEHSTGLGLWLVYWTVVVSDGELRFSTGDSGGTVVTIELPKAG